MTAEETDSITVGWEGSDVSGLANFTITLNNEKYVGTDTSAGGSKQFQGLTAGTSYQLVITTTASDGSTTEALNTNHYTGKCKF